MKIKLQEGGVQNANEIYFILQGLLDISRADLMTLDSFSRGQMRTIEKAVNKRIKGISLQLILGYTDFLGVKILENKHILSPRPETEYMTSIIAKENKGKVLDLCAGSGAIGLALAREGFDVTLSDVSAHAIKNIKRNAKNNNLHVNIVKSNMFDKVSGKYDIIVSNPPYIPSAECLTLDKDVLNNDPLIALDGGEDGLHFYRIIAHESWKYLTNSGVLYLEIGINQSKSVAKLLEKHYKNITIIKDMNDIDRIIRAEVK